MTTTNRPLADVPTAVLRATTRELVAELVRRIDAGELDAEDVLPTAERVQWMTWMSCAAS